MNQKTGFEPADKPCDHADKGCPYCKMVVENSNNFYNNLIRKLNKKIISVKR